MLKVERTGKPTPRYTRQSKKDTTKTHAYIQLHSVYGAGDGTSNGSGDGSKADSCTSGGGCSGGGPGGGSGGGGSPRGLQGRFKGR